MWQLGIQLGKDESYFLEKNEFQILVNMRFVQFGVLEQLAFQQSWHVEMREQRKYVRLMTCS